MRQIQPPNNCVNKARIREVAETLVRSVLIHLRCVLAVVNLVLHQLRGSTSGDRTSAEAIGIWESSAVLALERTRCADHWSSKSLPVGTEERGVLAELRVWSLSPPSQPQLKDIVSSEMESKTGVGRGGDRVQRVPREVGGAIVGHGSSVH